MYQIEYRDIVLFLYEDGNYYESEKIKKFIDFINLSLNYIPQRKYMRDYIEKIDEYVKQDIQNYNNMRTTGGSMGLQILNIPMSNIGYNQDTRDSSSSTNINVESQTIEYALNPSKFREDLDKAKQEIQDVSRAVSESINDRGDDNRNFFGQLSEVRLNETINNIAGERLERVTTQEDMKDTLEAAYKDLGYDVNIRISTPSETPELIGKGGTAYLGNDGKHTVIINSEYLNGKSKGEILGVISEEASHIINGVEGRTVVTGTDEKGLESTGRATNEYFQDKYKDDKTTINLTSEGSIDTSKLGTNVGDKRNEGATIYTEDLRNETRKIGNKEVKYTKDEIQNNIDWWFGKGNYKIDWDKYKTDAKYREKTNYYYFQARYALRVKSVDNIDGNYVTITQNNGEKMTLKKVPANQSIYHNMEYKNGTAYFFFDDRYKKYVQDDGYELILDKNNNPVYNPAITGTYNFYTYGSIFSIDAYDHLKDIQLWKDYGTGPTDKTTKEMRTKVGDWRLGAFIQNNFDKLKSLETKMGRESFSYEELQDIKNKGIDNYGK